MSPKNVTAKNRTMENLSHLCEILMLYLGTTFQQLKVAETLTEILLTADGVMKKLEGEELTLLASTPSPQTPRSPRDPPPTRSPIVLSTRRDSLTASPSNRRDSSPSVRAHSQTLGWKKSSANLSTIRGERRNFFDTRAIDWQNQEKEETKEEETDALLTAGIIEEVKVILESTKNILAKSQNKSPVEEIAESAKSIAASLGKVTKGIEEISQKSGYNRPEYESVQLRGKIFDWVLLFTNISQMKL